MRHTAFNFNIRGISTKLCGAEASVFGLNFGTNTRRDLLKRNCKANLEEMHEKRMWNFGINIVIAVGPQKNTEYLDLLDRTQNLNISQLSVT